MEPRKLRKLVLKKEVITQLSEENQRQIVGGVSDSITMDCCVKTVNCLTYNIIPCLTMGAYCDLPTIGHDDGYNCISKENPICYGIG